ncbi:proteasome activator complex subunit 4-like [Tropilaelaps mercedesae]|uniref:Proteasome activator complex subunit 4-like n=1 Tax=Tropilaelaps mercedesae TaxID=418985 RepID=A0A1V9X601_9ACAR|nr:proteasome activator complex subunit 4-like [Tropilaelaps mercedesae]
MAITTTMIASSSEDDDLPRRFNKYNALLPYGDRLEAEAKQFFTEIKIKIAECLANAEIRPGLVNCLANLRSFTGLHGFYFSKEEHVELIHLLIDIILLPDLDLGTIAKISSVICRLLRKKHLLTPSDLTIEWRPLFKLSERCLNRSLEDHGLIQCPQTLESQLNTLIRLCRPYFPLSATQEMLDEWLVDMCPYDDFRDTLVRRFQLFLPTTLPPAHFDKGWQLWFERFITLWRLDRRGGAETILVGLFARLAEDNIGYVDWEPYIPDIFTRLLRSFNLPYGNGNLKVARSVSSTQCEIAQFTRWIISLLGGGSSAQTHLELLFKTIESFYHPSNSGRWTLRLTKFLAKLTENFLERLWLERRKLKTWRNEVPEQKKLQEDDIDAFVNTIHPIALMAMFLKSHYTNACSALQDIAWLRPVVVVSAVLEELNDSLYNLTEPHRLTSSLISMGYVSRLLVLNHNRLKVRVDIPNLLMSCLPGIDSNDNRKTTVTLQVISTLVAVVPLVDCSSLADSVAPDLHEACLTTAAFEDFVLELISRCVAHIDNTAADNQHRDCQASSLDDNILDVALSSTFSAVFSQCSTAIYRSALDRLAGLIENKIIGRVPGKQVATIVRCAVAADPPVGVEVFLARYAKRALILLEADEVLFEENIDNELQFAITLLSETVRWHGDGIRPHMPLLMRFVCRALQLNARTGYLDTALMVRHTFHALTAVYPYFFKPNRGPLVPTVDDLPILHWGESEDMKTIQVQWHVPSDEDIQCARQLFDACTQPQLERLRLWCDDAQANAMTKIEVQRSLTLILDTLQGLGSCLPPLSGDPINVLDTKTSTFCNRVQNTGKIIFSETLRGDILNDIERVVGMVSLLYEDDIKSFVFICHIIKSLVFYFGMTKPEFEVRYKGYKFSKQMFDLRLVEGSVKHTRSVIIDRAQLHHELRLIAMCQQFTTNHKRAMHIIFKLAISHYSQVRVQAQDVLDMFFTQFPRSYSFVLDEMCSLLVSPSMSHDQYKGILYILVGNKDHNLVTMNNWVGMAKLWPSLVNAQHSEKPSIIALISRLQEQVVKFMETYPMVSRVPESIVWRAQALAETSVTTRTVSDSATPPVSENASEKQVTSGEANEAIYYALVSDLTRLVGSGKLHWRYHYLGLVMLKMLLRHDVPYKEETVRMLTTHLISEHLRTRKICIDILTGVLYQQKRKMLKVKVKREDIDEVNAQVPLNATFAKSLDGNKRRPFNLFLQLNSANRPDTQERWDKAIFIHKPYIGYSGLKQEVEVYAPDKDQPQIPSADQMSSVERIIHDSFTNPEFVKQFIFYLAIEENKGKDKFEAERVIFFKSLFRNYGDAFIVNFDEYLNRFLKESKQESEQRCALEILAGMVRGAKHWNFPMNKRLAEFVVPLFAEGMNNILPETMSDWGACVATMFEGRDCNKFHWFFDIITKNLYDGSSFLQACRMYTLLGGLVQMRWRVQELGHRLLDEMIPNLAHPYLNVRERMAHLLANIFAFDVRVNDGVLTKFDNDDNFVLAPKSIDFEMQVMTSLEMLKLDNHEQKEEIAKRSFQTR